jgi:hypothetical protein
MAPTTTAQRSSVAPISRIINSDLRNLILQKRTGGLEPPVLFYKLYFQDLTPPFSATIPRCQRAAHK